MNGYNFTEAVRRALAQARTEAARLHHEYVGTEHELLGLLRYDDTVAATVLKACDVELEALANAVDGVVVRGAARPTGPDLPYTSRAKKALEEAMSEARERGHAYVGTEHLLLGILREEKGIAAQLLVDFGVTYEVAYRKTSEALNAGATEDSHPPVRATTSAGQKAAAMLKHALGAPEVAAVFAAHAVDVPRLLADLEQARPN